MSHTDIFKNKRELNRFLKHTNKFYENITSIDDAFDAFAKDNCTDAFEVIASNCKDPAIGFPKEGSTGWANTRRAYREHWAKSDIAIQSCLSEWKRRKELRAS
jgi:hypothetical protein